MPAGRPCKEWSNSGLLKPRTRRQWSQVPALHPAIALQSSLKDAERHRGDSKALGASSWRTGCGFTPGAAPLATTLPAFSGSDPQAIGRRAGNLLRHGAKTFTPFA